MDISICTGILEKNNRYGFLEDKLWMLSDSGYRNIEISRVHPISEKLHSTINNLNMSVWAVHGLLDYTAISLSESTRERAIEEELLRMETASCYAPCPYVIHYLYRVNDRKVKTAWCKCVEKLHEKAIEHKLVLALETVPYKPEYDKRYVTTREVSEFVRLYASPNMKICLDLNHSNLKEDIIVAIQNCEDLISTIHVSDNNGMREQHLFPGDGVIDFSRTLKALLDIGYEGPCNLECRNTKNLDVNILKKLRIDMEKCITKIG